MSKGFRNRGKVSLTKYFATFEPGSKVQLILEPSIHKGDYNTRFYGRPGTVQKKTGSCYVVEIKDGNKKKMILSHPIHLKRLE